MFIAVEGDCLGILTDSGYTTPCKFELGLGDVFRAAPEIVVWDAGLVLSRLATTRTYERGAWKFEVFGQPFIVKSVCPPSYMIFSGKKFIDLRSLVRWILNEENPDEFARQLCRHYRKPLVMLFPMLLEKIKGIINSIPELYGMSLEKIYSWGSLAKKVLRQNYRTSDQEFNNQFFREAYTGGFTVNFFRGIVPAVMNFDYSGFYGNIMAFLESERYINNHLRQISPSCLGDGNPQLCLVRSNSCFPQSKFGLIPFFTRRLGKPEYMTNYDLLFRQRLANFQGIPFDFEVDQLWSILPATQSKKMLEEIQLNRKGADNRHKKFLYKAIVNSLYGCYCQSNPKDTGLTNFVIASLITSFARAELMKTAIYLQEILGKPFYYCDTDGFFTDLLSPEEEGRLIRHAKPFSLTRRGQGRGIFVSPKKYAVLRSLNPMISRHGVGDYQVDFDRLLNPLNSIPFDRMRKLNSLQTIPLMIWPGNETGKLLQQKITASTPEVITFLKSQGIESLPFESHLVDSGITEKDFFVNYFGQQDQKTKSVINTDTGWRKFRVFDSESEAQEKFF